MKNVEIKVEIQVNEIYSKTIITQELFNNQEYPLELEVFIKKIMKIIFFHHLMLK